MATDMLIVKIKYDETNCNNEKNIYKTIKLLHSSSHKLKFTLLYDSC